MNLACSSNGIIEFEYPKQGIIDIEGGGFRSVSLDLSKLCHPDVLEKWGKKSVRNPLSEKILKTPETMLESLAPLMHQCNVNSLSVDLVIAPYLHRDTKRKDWNHLLLQLARESIKVCGAMNCRYIVIRPLFAGISSELLWEKNKEFYLSLVPLAEEHNVMILLENQCRDINGHMVRGICSDAVEASEWVDELNREARGKRFAFCMNTGVLSLCGQNVYDFSVALGDRIRTVILSDCSGGEEMKLLPFSGARKGVSPNDWLNLIRGLRRIAFDGNFILEFEDTARAFSPMLRPQLMTFARETGAFLKWQVELDSLVKRYRSRVLFGAGNMCRAYMKCYGEEYPPLFTCDNNCERWGTTFCDLEVKNPECLKELPEDVAIFICNVYYRDIEQQLRAMELKNPIVYFNDEYLQSFHLNRVEDLVN